MMEYLVMGVLDDEVVYLGIAVDYGEVGYFETKYDGWDCF